MTRRLCVLWGVTTVLMGLTAGWIAQAVVALSTPPPCRLGVRTVAALAPVGTGIPDGIRLQFCVCPVDAASTVTSDGLTVLIYCDRRPIHE